MTTSGGGDHFADVGNMLRRPDFKEDFIMIEEIKAKMESHIKSILEKPIITDQEYSLIASYLCKLEYEASFEENKDEQRQKEMWGKIAEVIGGAM